MSSHRGIDRFLLSHNLNKDTEDLIMSISLEEVNIKAHKNSLGLFSSDFDKCFLAINKNDLIKKSHRIILKKANDGKFSALIDEIDLDLKNKGIMIKRDAFNFLLYMYYNLGFNVYLTSTYDDSMALSITWDMGYI